MANKVQLTKKYIESIKPENKKQVEIIDQAEPVLRVIAYANKTSFVGRVWWQGRRYCKTFGTFPYLPIPKARQLAAQFKLSIQTGEYHQSAKITLNEFITKHYAPWVISNNKTGQEYLRRLASFVLPKLGNLQLGHIGRLDIMDLLDKRAQQVKPSTVNRDHSLLSSVFRLAIEKGYIEENKSPVKGIKQRAENNANKKTLPNHTQLKTLISKCESMPEEQFGCDLILLLIYSGLRVSEALSLRRHDIADDICSFRLIDNKSKRPVQLPLNTEAQKIVKRCLANSWNDFLFPSPVNKDTAMTAPRRLLALLKAESEIKELSFHYFRAVFLSIIARKNIHLASKLANHSNATVTERYIYHTDEVMTSASELVVQHLK